MNTELIERVEVMVEESQDAHSVIAQADNLAAQHENFHSNYIVAGRAALYRLLANIYELAEKLDCHEDRDDQVTTMRSVLAEKYDIRTQENTSKLTVLVRYVTRADRKTAHVYSRAIEVAKANQIRPDQLVGYLESQGGLERIRAKAAADAGDEIAQQDLEERVDLAKRYLTARREFPVTTFKVGKIQLEQLGELSELSLLICSESEGRIAVLAKAPLDLKLEKKVIESIAQQFPKDLISVRKNVNRFYEKAIRKRTKKTNKRLLKKRPKLAEAMMRINKIRLLARSKSMTQSI